MIRSPFFYVGDKYKLVPQLLQYFPKKINKYIEPFYGGGSSQLQVGANEYFLNDLDNNVIALHKMLIEYCDNKEIFFSKLFYYVGKYKLSCSFIEDIVPKDLKKKYPKTYYSHFNKEAYDLLKKDYNNDKNNFLLLYLLLIYGFNHMIRFNNRGEFNLPVGNVDLNKNVFEALAKYLELQKSRKINFSSKDFEEFITQIKFEQDDFVYLDPPYLISMSEYNKYWNEEDEKRLYKLLDTLNENGVKFGLTNLLQHKGKTNFILFEWSKKYHIVDINSNYISFNDNTVKEGSHEIYVHN